MPPQSLFLRPPFSTYLHFYFLLLSAYPSSSPSLLYNHLCLSLLIFFSSSSSSWSLFPSPLLLIPSHPFPTLFPPPPLAWVPSYSPSPSILFLSFSPSPLSFSYPISYFPLISSFLLFIPFPSPPVSLVFLFILSLSLPSLPISFPPSPPFSLSPPFLHLPLSLSTPARCWSPPPRHNFRLWMRVVWSCKCLHYSSSYSHIMYFY